MIKESDYPPLSVLIAFEATVRRGSMTAAAKELGITQPLVSQRIRSLEDYMGGVLLDRTHKPIKTTSAGSKFYQELKIYLSPLLTSLEKTKKSLNDNKVKVSISAYFGFAFYWLLPRLSKLQAHFPDYLFEVRPTNSKHDMMSFNSDISFHFCNELREYRFEELFIEEEVFPVCSPSLASKLKLSEDQTLTNLSELPLLHKDQNDARWINWQNWSNILGVNLPADPVSFCYQNYPLTIEAAIAGQGICLGWKGLLDKQLEEGTLIALKPALTSPKRGYYICSNYKSTATVGPVIDWLIEERNVTKIV